MKRPTLEAADFVRASGNSFWEHYRLHVAQNLHHHPHIHYIVPSGGLATDSSKWIASSQPFFLSVAALSRVFRSKFVAGLKQLFRQEKIHFRGSLQNLADPVRFRQFLRELFRNDWVVYAKPPLGGRSVNSQRQRRFAHRKGAMRCSSKPDLRHQFASFA